MNNSMIEVDPKLFITCRLCLEDMGQYQIVPAVQHQIKYCFDIDVEPFDGLPQLICRKCEAILSDYFTTKKTFINKQNGLKTEIGVRKVKLEQSQQEIVSSSQQYDSETVSSNQVLTCKNRRVHIPSTSSDTYSARSDTSLTKSANRKKSPSSWKHDYNKLYGCKLCKRHFKRKCDVKKHNIYNHESIREKYNSILNINCKLKLEKLDGKPNMTGRNTVVYDHSRIIEDGDVDYFVMYISKNITLENDIYDGLDDSDQEFVIKKKRRKRRLISKSSNDTLVIETNDDNKLASDDERPVIEIKPKDQDKSECIHIDDSSDSSTDKNDLQNDHQSTVRKKIKAEFNDYKTIQNIITMCQNKYQKRVDVDMQNNKVSGNHSSNSQSQLKRKVLSIGRKVVNRQTLFNCTGILRFMEHKNLEVIWVPKPPINCSKDAYYVRILTKIKTNKIEADNNDLGWTDISNVVLKQNVNVPAPCSALNIQSNENVLLDASYSGVCYKDTNVYTVDHKNKLLNANPVANPKQLPKKPITNELKSNNIITISTIQNTPTLANVTPIAIEDNVENIDNLCMPIITSTTSLAPVQNETENKRNEVTIEPETCETHQLSNAVNTNMPRIKVKPVSELMPEKGSKNISDNTPSVSNIVNHDQQTNIYNQQKTIHYFPGVVVASQVPQMKIVQVQSASGSLSAEKPTTPAAITVTNSDCVILDTVELPNTKTAVPFKYLATLLQIHNIILLETNATLSHDSLCLIKFKVLYKQETKDQPVVLCLSLFCLKNTFCIKVKDRNQENIDMTKISANWQWEIIKIFKGDVVQKLLQNAQKVSQEVFEYTKSFLCLIRSINLVTEL